METTSRGTKPKSIVWNYFHSEEDLNGRQLMKCCFCDFSSYSTKNATKLRQHLTRRCPHISSEAKDTIVSEVDDKYLSPEDNTQIESIFSMKSKSNKSSELVFKEEDDEESEDFEEEVIFSSESSSDKSRLKTLEEENKSLNSRLSLCQKQKDALLEVTKHLDNSLNLWKKIDSISNKYSMGREEKINELKNELKDSNYLANEWKRKLKSMDLNTKFEELFNKTVEPPVSNYKPLSSIWKYYQHLDSTTTGIKEIKCIFCSKVFRHKNLNAVKCRTHIVENCESCPQDIKDKEDVWVESVPKSKIDVWKHFIINDDDKWTAQCMYCGTSYMGRNATRSREHLVFKCEAIPDDVRESLRSKCDTSFLFNNIQQSLKTKSSDIWQHFDITEENGKTTCRCIYCSQVYGHKNATKFRQHLVDKCIGIPGDIRSDIAQQSCEQSRTWTQTKIPVWTHFEMFEEDGKQLCRCIYCDFTYSKNATKCRLHLMFKCREISSDKREEVRNECKNSFMTAIQKKTSGQKKIRVKHIRKTPKDNNEMSGTKRVSKLRSQVWEHYTEESDADGNTTRRCNYCCTLFTIGMSRNATRMRDHLGLTCKAVPDAVKIKMQELNDGSVRSYRKNPERRRKTSFECCWPGCEMVFNKQSLLLKHQVIHTGLVKRIKCDWPGCDWTGRDKTSCRIHRCSHTGEKPWPCDWPNCDFRTAKPSSLYVHKLRHKNLLRFKCEWPGCERTFLTSSQRKVHTMVHLGLKPFGCQYCERRYPQLNKLKTHQRKHHSNENLKY